MERHRNFKANNVYPLKENPRVRRKITMFKEYLRAGFPALWIQTSEPHRTAAEWGEEAAQAGYRPFQWDCQQGFRALKGGFKKEESDPLKAVSFLATGAAGDGRAILFLHNFHRFIKAVEVIQEILNVVSLYKVMGRTLIVLAPTVESPTELEKVFTVLNFDLPDKETLKKTLMYMADSAKMAMPTEEETETILEAAKGLTSFEFENALALSLVTKKKFDPAVIVEQKTQLIRKNASLMLENYDETLENLGGLENLKQFCLKIARSPLAKGVLLLGTPGTGKSHFAKGLGKALGIPTAGLDFGRMFGSLVGESEGRIREALKIVDAFSPCILFIDEIEKGLSGIQSSGQTDGGTGSRVFGTFLTWLNDHRSRVFVIATCNDISKIPPEFLRAERWDAIFFIDLPSTRERKIILDLYKKMYHIEGEPTSTEGWSGAEIKSVCRIAAMMQTTIREAECFVMPLSRSMADKIEGLRQWAKERTIPASFDQAPAQADMRRKIN
jgi:ATP-dependent 26S proteasome regulatory subunit